MKRITRIDIENIRGIGAKESFYLELLPNKPHVVIAPNGTGKTSFAKAFASLGARKLKVDDDSRFLRDPANKASLTVHYEEEDGTPRTASADENSNLIDKVLAVHVIHSRLNAKARKFKAGGATAAAAELRVTPITVARIVDKAAIDYRYIEVEKSLGWGRRSTMNLTKLLSSDEALAEAPLSELGSITPARVKHLKESISTAANGQSSAIAGWFSDNPTAELVADWVEKYAPDVANYRLAVAQLLVLFQSNKKQFRSAVKHAKYKRTKAAYRKATAEVSAAAFGDVRVDEDKRTGELRCVFPEASRMSNGERDAVILAVQLAVAQTLAGSKPLLVIIDEVFDYLDRGNLIAFQYYVTELLKHCKETGCQALPLILTHHEAGYFFHSSLAAHKIREIYLHPRRCDRSRSTIRLLELREDASHKDDLENDFFHYSENASGVAANGLPSTHSSSDSFRDYCRQQAEQFVKKQKYDAVAVCFAIRHEVERRAHDQLDTRHRPGFLATRTTNRKLEYAEEHGAAIRDSHYLLGLIHNDTLHWKQGRDYVTPLEATLEHGVVVRLVRALFTQ